MTNELDYNKIALRLLNAIPYNQIPDYIEMYYNESPLKGSAFYSKIIHAVPDCQSSTKAFPSKANDIWNHCKKRINEIDHPTTKTKLTGFQCALTDEQINILYNQMQGTYFDATPEHFKAIFKKEILPQDCSIKWLKTNVLLSYLIKKLFHSDNPFDLWVKTEKLFGIKNLNKSECNNPNPKGCKDIDVILKNIYTNLQ